MNSFIYTLSIFVLVLANGYFTLPIVDEQLSTEKAVLDDQTSISSAIDTKRTVDEHIGFTVSPPVDENLVQKIPRTFDEFSTSEPMSFTTEEPSKDKRNLFGFPIIPIDPMMFTTEEPSKDKRDHEDSVSTSSDSMMVTTEQSSNEKRDHHDLDSSSSEPMTFTTEEPSKGKRNLFGLPIIPIDPMMFTTEEPSKDKRDYEDSVSSSSEPMMLTTEESPKDKRNLFGFPMIPIDPMLFTTEEPSNDTLDHNDYPFTTAESFSQIPELERRDFEDKLESKTEEMPVELTTIDTLSFSSTSSTNAPELYESEPTVSTSTEHKLEHETEENLKESTIPTALYDQDALKFVSKLPSGVAILDDNKDFIVRNIAENSTIPIQKHVKKEEVKLNQGKESSHIEEKESNN